MAPPASIVIPTRERLPYLEVALESIAAQAARVGAEVLVIDDAGPSAAARALVERFGARYQPHPQPLGLNIARNTGVERSHGELVVFVDDDIRAAPDWLDALLRAAAEHPDVDVFAGQIRACVEGRGGWGSHSCGRERPPITTLELGSNDVELGSNDVELGAHDTDAAFAWGANMAIRRTALERVGPFDVTLAHGGDEQEWQERLRAHTPGASVLYVAGACDEHRRVGPDTRLRSLARTAHARGRAARRFDVRRAHAPSLAGELYTLARCAAHVVLRRCPAGMTMVAHSAGRVREALRERIDTSTAHVTAHDSDALNGARVPGAGVPHTAAGQAIGAGHTTDDFLSGASGTVGGLDAVRRGARDGALDAWELISTRRLRLGLAARHRPPLRRVLVLGVQRPEHVALAREAAAELLRSRHQVELHTRPADGLGKFENLNLLLAEHGRALDAYDWLLVLDDDVQLPHGFLDRFLFLCERYSLSLAQPAHRLRSHAAWQVTRRRGASAVRETAFVEIGPVTAFAAATLPVLLPFPQLRMGWGLDVHWAALAREHGWRCGVVDALPIAHLVAPAAASYPREQAIAEARSFLAERPYLSAREAGRTLTTHRGW
jgi:GT2 family glycosyltransferase